MKFHYDYYFQNNAESFFFINLLETNYLARWQSLFYSCANLTIKVYDNIFRKQYTLFSDFNKLCWSLSHPNNSSILIKHNQSYKVL